MLHLEDNLMYYYHIFRLCDLYFKALWFCLISPTVWYLNVIFTYNDTVWPKLSPQSKYKSVWPVFYGLVILHNIFKIIEWINIIVGIMHQCDHQINFSSTCICRSVTYILWPSKFASCLEDYLLQESCTWDDRSVSLKDWHCKLYLAFIVINFKIFYN